MIRHWLRLHCENETGICKPQRSDSHAICVYRKTMQFGCTSANLNIKLLQKKLGLNVGV